MDVAYSSLMENTELALALREHYLEKIAIYLSRCGLQSNSELVEKGYPDLGWDPVEGERFELLPHITGEILTNFSQIFGLFALLRLGERRKR